MNKDRLPEDRSSSGTVHLVFLPSHDAFLVYASSWSDLLPAVIAETVPTPAPEDHIWRIMPSAVDRLAWRLEAAGYAVSGLDRSDSPAAWARLLLEHVEIHDRDKVFAALLKALDLHELAGLADAFEAMSR